MTAAYSSERMAFAFGPFQLDVPRRQLLTAGAEVHLSPKAFQLLEILIERRPDVLSKAELHDRLWPDTFVAGSSLASVVKELRAALKDDPHAPRYIRTVHGYGYAFCGDDAKPLVAVARLTWDRGEALLYLGRNILGRDPSAGVRIDDRTVSRQHAAIDINGDTATIVDLGSKNGTTLGGLAVSSSAVPLVEGDVIIIGSVEVRFCAIVDASTATLHADR